MIFHVTGTSNYYTYDTNDESTFKGKVYTQTPATSYIREEINCVSYLQYRKKYELMRKYYKYYAKIFDKIGMINYKINGLNCPF